MMDNVQVKNKAIVELLYKVESLCQQEVLGIKSKYCWDESIIKYGAIKVLEDTDAEETTQECAAWYLNDKVDQKIVTNNTVEMLKIYVPVSDKHYRGTIASAAQMAVVELAYKEEGWWWNITGTFSYQGVNYTPDNEVYWTNSGWSLYGYGVPTNMAVGIDVATGALVANVDKSVFHGLDKTSFQFEVKDNLNNVLVNKLVVDPADPTNAVLIQVGDDIAEGLIISVIGY